MVIYIKSRAVPTLVPICPPTLFLLPLMLVGSEDLSWDRNKQMGGRNEAFCVLSVDERRGIFWATIDAAQVFSFRRRSSIVVVCERGEKEDFVVWARTGCVRCAGRGTAVTYSPGKQFSPHDLKINGLKFVVTAVWDGASLSIMVVWQEAVVAAAAVHRQKQQKEARWA